MRSIQYFFRKPNSEAHSIEEIFKNLILYLQNKDENLNLEQAFVPYYSSTLSGIFKNIIYVRNNQGDINHITGDIHYVALGLSRRNLNILTIHDCGFVYRFSRWNIKYWLLKWLWLSLPVRRVDIITTISEKSRADILYFTGCNPSKVITIPNFINPLFKPVPYDFNMNMPHILHIGTTKNKNLERLIPALKGIRCKFEIIGKTPSDIQSLLIENKINYSTSYNLTSEEIVEKYRGCDLVIFISTFEGFGMPIIEANQTGRPVITSNISPMREVAAGSAHLVDPYSIDEIREAVIKIINEKDYRDLLISKGLKNAQRFSIDRVSQQYLNLYNQKKP